MLRPAATGPALACTLSLFHGTSNAWRGSDANPNTFTDGQGLTRAYAWHAAALFVERGEYLTVRGCTITGSGNGFFVASGGSEEVVSREILVEGCHIYGNGNPGRDREHNVYTEALGMVFQYNRLGRLRAGAGGNNLKDRSAGTVVRYNWIEGGAHLLDLVEAEESTALATADPRYHTTYVYGNVLLNEPGDGTFLVHYGGDNGNVPTYRKGVLHFYHNTVVVRCNQGGAGSRWRTILFRLETNDETVEARNNIFYRAAATAGATATEWTLMNTAGRAQFRVNWVSPGWLTSRSGLPFTGSVAGTKQLVTTPDNAPGFRNLATLDLRLEPRSPCLDSGGSLSAAVPGQYAATLQYVVHQRREPRPGDANQADLGAFAGTRAVGIRAKGLTRALDSRGYPGWRFGEFPAPSVLPAAAGAVAAGTILGAMVAGAGVVRKRRRPPV